MTIVDTEAGGRVVPTDRRQRTDNHTSAALETAAMIQFHRGGIIAQAVQPGRTGPQANSGWTTAATGLIYFDVAVLVLLDGTQGDFFFYFQSEPFTF